MAKYDLIVIGGGAAGVFGAITAAQFAPQAAIRVCEASSRFLSKVLVSGGGRCNVTTSQFDPTALIRFYPRGSRELLGPFHRFQPRDMMQWCEARGVALKIEEDGRVFPVSDSSETIASMLLHAARGANIELRVKSKIRNLRSCDGGIEVTIESSSGSTTEVTSNVLVATGSASGGYSIAQALGHSLQPPVPSLFSFTVPDAELTSLTGVSVPSARVILRVGKEVFDEQGAVLITHWGLSGPAIIRLSAWAARELAQAGYKGELEVNWLGMGEADISETLDNLISNSGATLARNLSFPNLPRKLWQFLLERAGVDPEKRVSSISKLERKNIHSQLADCPLQLAGKGVFKEEFVTCGGVTLSEVDFRTMESKLTPGLYFAGEVLDIDGVTGGYNFQAAWTTGFIAGRAIGQGRP